MKQLVVDFPEDDELELDLGQNADRSSGALLLAASEWRALLWQTYQQANHPAVVFVVSIPHPTGDPSDPEGDDPIRFVTDESLFGSIAKAFLDYGEPALVAVRKACRVNASVQGAGRQLVQETVALFERLLGEQLTFIEHFAAQRVSSELKERLGQTRASLNRFQTIDYDGSKFKFCSRAGLNELYPLLIDAHRHTIRITGLQAKIDKRNYADGGNRNDVRRKRERDPYRQMLVELSAGPQRTLISELSDLRVRIGSNWPEAVLILDQLDDDVKHLLPVPRPDGTSRTADQRARLAELKFHSRIYAALATIEKTAEQALVAMSRPGIKALLEQFNGTSPSQRDEGLFARITSVILSERVSDVRLTMAAQADGDNPNSSDSAYLELRSLRSLQGQTRNALAIAPLLMRLGENQLEISAGTFREAVLIHFHLHLENEIDRRQRSQADSDAFWKQVQFVSAIGGLLFAAATLPFGGEATLPASLSLLRSATTIGLFVTGLALTIHGLTSMLEAIGDADHAVQNKLLELGQTDPEALDQLGKVIARNNKLVKEGGREFVQALIGMAFGGAIRPLGRALQLQDYYYDIESIYDQLGEGMGEDEADGE